MLYYVFAFCSVINLNQTIRWFIFLFIPCRECGKNKLADGSFIAELSNPLGLIPGIMRPLIWDQVLAQGTETLPSSDTGESQVCSKVTHLDESFMQTRNSRGPRNVPCGTGLVTSPQRRQSVLYPLEMTLSNLGYIL